MNLKLKIDDLELAVKYAKQYNSSDWVTVTIQPDETFEISFEDNEKQTAKIELHHAAQSVTPKLHKITRLYKQEI